MLLGEVSISRPHIVKGGSTPRLAWPIGCFSISNQKVPFEAYVEIYPVLRLSQGAWVAVFWLSSDLLHSQCGSCVQLSCEQLPDGAQHAACQSLSLIWEALKWNAVHHDVGFQHISMHLRILLICLDSCLYFIISATVWWERCRRSVVFIFKPLGAESCVLWRTWFLFQVSDACGGWNIHLTF